MEARKLRESRKKSQKNDQSVTEDNVDRVKIAKAYHANLEIITEKCAKPKCKEKGSLSYACVVTLKPNSTVGVRADQTIDMYVVPFAQLTHEKTVGMGSAVTKKVQFLYIFSKLSLTAYPIRLNPFTDFNKHIRILSYT